MYKVRRIGPSTEPCGITPPASFALKAHYTNHATLDQTGAAYHNKVHVSVPAVAYKEEQLLVWLERAAGGSEAVFAQSFHNSTCGSTIL